MRSTLAWLHARTENVAAALLAAMFVAFMLQIVFRYVINVPLEWTQEACLTTWLWAVFWGAAFNLRERDHVRFDVLYAMGGRGARRIMALISALSITIAFAVSLPATIGYITFYKIKSSATMGIRLDYVFSVYGLFAVAMILRYGLRSLSLLRGADPDLLDGNDMP